MKALDTCQRFLLPLLILLLVFIHFYPFDLSGYKLINYDDEIFIRPMLKLGLTNYFTRWLPDPNNYAYPLRDLTLFFDHWVSEASGVGFYYVTNFIFFVATLGCIHVLVGMFLPRAPWLRLFLMVLISLHPLNVELVQWASARKNIMPPFFIALGNVLVLRRFLAGEALQRRHWVMVILLQGAALACYPVTALWLFWVLALQWGRAKKLNLLGGATLLGLVTLAYLRLIAPAGTDFGNGFEVLTSQFDKVSYFFPRSLGRGFFNTVWPDQLMIYYDADNVRSPLGVALFCCYLIAMAVLLWTVQDKTQRLSLAVLGGLVIALMLPQAHVFLSFADFRWADRYSYIVNPYFFLFNALLVTQSQLGRAATAVAYRALASRFPPGLSQEGGARLALIVCGLFVLAYGVLSRQLVPRWRSEMSLQEACAKDEGSPKCLAIMMSEYFTDNCSAARPYIELGYQRYRNNPPPYSSQFTLELPFYDATCVAITASYDPGQKLELIPTLFDRYPGSPGPVFGLTLAYLEAGALQEALALAKTYALKGDGSSLHTSKLLAEIYLGHTKALCEIAEAADCWQARQVLVGVYEGFSEKSFPFGWGYNITKLMHERRLHWQKKEVPPPPPAASTPTDVPAPK